MSGTVRYDPHPGIPRHQASWLSCSSTPRPCWPGRRRSGKCAASTATNRVARHTTSMPVEHLTLESTLPAATPLRCMTHSLLLGGAALAQLALALSECRAGAGCIERGSAEEVKESLAGRSLAGLLPHRAVRPYAQPPSLPARQPSAPAYSNQASSCSTSSRHEGAAKRSLQEGQGGKKAHESGRGEVKAG